MSLYFSRKSMAWIENLSKCSKKSVGIDVCERIHHFGNPTETIGKDFQALSLWSVMLVNINLCLWSHIAIARIISFIVEFSLSGLLIWHLFLRTAFVLTISSFLLCVNIRLFKTVVFELFKKVLKCRLCSDNFVDICLLIFINGI